MARRRAFPGKSMRDLLTGAAIGGLVGLLLGLSVSETVGAVVAGLTALIGAFFGLVERAPALPSAGPARIAGFALGAAALALVGVHLRATDALGASEADRLAAWRGIGFSPEEARGLVAFEKLGLAPEGTAVAAAPQAARTTALFNSGAAESCAALSQPVYGSAAALRSAFVAEGGAWAGFAEAVPDAPEAEQTALLRAALALVCG
jgi:hypothetical protein